ncbi:DUF6287 domain-containing protein [Enterococcus avium]|jgi:hypothetical protein|uniref:DUF6287 domain-containing protein n=1 Tax=Enterococcus avium TaxID=33945 RepID=UPI0032E45837
MKSRKLILLTAFVSIGLVGCSTNDSTNSSSSSKETSDKASSSSIIASSENSSTITSSTSSNEITVTSSSLEKRTDSTGLEENAILIGDYTSMNGTWTNSNGYQLTFNNGEVTLSGDGVGGATHFTLNEPVKQSNVIFLSFDPAPAPNGMNLMLALKGTSPSEGLDEDGTDSSRDRIIMGNNGGTMLFAPKEKGGIPDTAYYKDN